jgi:hypothetical protein
MHEWEDIDQIHQTNRTVLHRRLELLDTHVGKIEERINQLTRLKVDILNYRETLCQKLTLLTEDPRKGGELDEGSGDH